MYCAECEFFGFRESGRHACSRQRVGYDVLYATCTRGGATLVSSGVEVVGIFDNTRIRFPPPSEVCCFDKDE